MSRQTRFSIAPERHFGDRTVLCYTPRPQSLVHAIRKVFEQHPDREAIVEGESSLRFRDLDERSNALAHVLARRGINAGDRVAVVLANRNAFVVSVVAVLRLGAIVVPVNVRESTSGFTHILGNCEASAVIVEQDLLPVLPNDDVIPSMRFRIVVSDDPASDEFENLCQADGSNAAPLWSAPEEEAPALLLYTSGTTGAPKGAVLTHFNVVHTTLHYTDFWQLDQFERTVLAVPASHVTGIVALIFTNLVNAGCTVMMRRFDSREYVRLAARHRQTWTILVPAMYNMCLLDGGFDTPGLDAWRVGGFGGAPMPAATVEALGRALPALELLNAYGSTECASVVVATPPGRSDKSLTTVGTTVPCCEMRLVMNGVDVLPGESGEVWLRGPNTVPGYWNDPKRTGAGFVDGFWRSGDIGSTDEDGWLVLHDRIDDVINRGGYKVYGVEIENLLIAHDEIVEAAVVGIDDEILGQGICAIVVPRTPALDAPTVRDYCRAHLANYKTPDRVIFRQDPLPRNANGKILKRDLRQIT